MRSRLAETRTWLEARPHTMDALAVLLVVGGAALRIYRSTALSLWLDEGFTVLFARLPWDSVLGLHGAYDTHPPLYYALVKAVSLLVPEVVAGRYLSVFAGTATLAVLYLLVVRIAGRPAALVACLVAAVSPLAVWYSQEARQYAVTGLAVSVAYLALVAFYGRPRTRWALAYGVALASAVYLDYSALYALAPQLVLLPFVVYRHQRRAISIIVAGCAAEVAYVPWLPNVVGTVRALGNQRASYLEATPTAIWDSLLSITGLGGQGIYFASSEPSPWERWGSLDPVLGAVAIAAITLGGIALARHRFGLALVCALSLGTVVAGVLLSQLSPGFAPRTVSYAVLGWAILLGAAAGGGSMSIPRRVTGWVVVTAMVVVSAASLQALYHGDKQHWNDWAAGVAEAAPFGFPVVTFPTIAPTFLDAYQPRSLAGPNLALGDAPDLAALGSFVNGERAVWVASFDIASGASIDPFLRAAGLERVTRQEYFYGLSLNLYVRSGVTLGRPLTVNTEFTQATGGTSGWDLAPGMSSVQPGVRGPELTLSNAGGTEPSAVLVAIGAPRRLYSLTFEARSRLSSGGMRAFLICAGGGSFRNVAPDGAGASVPAGPSWQTLTFSAFCPDGTDQIRIDLRNAGVGALDLRGVRLYEAAPP
jgi:4-amino-4-deoxy-L-arabinose transferase-like glycosyltransferase